MRHPWLLSAAAFAACSPAVAGNWSGKGELGLAVARGNAESENLNLKAEFANEDDQWRHRFRFAALRARGEVRGDFDNDGVVEERLQLTANRYEVGGASALKLDERRYWETTLRYENDDFAPYSHQSTIAVSYGHKLIESEATGLALTIGPGVRNAEDAVSGDSETAAIVRGAVDFRHRLTDNTELVNALLVESGTENTFAQNVLGLEVAMNSKLALKAAIEARHNTDVEAGIEKTDTLTTVNLVYRFK